jgi:integrase
VIAALPEPIADLVQFEHLTGWRGGEAQGLTWAQVDRQRGEIRLQDTKNGEGRVLPLVGDLAWLIERRWLARKLLDGTECPFVFHRNGKPIVDYRHVWRKACKAAGVEGRVPHDFRRSAARDMIDAGVDPQTAMVVTGHRSLSMLMRYRIVDTKTTARALERLQAHRASHEADTQGDNGQLRAG